MASEMTPTPVVKIATDQHTGRLVGVLEFEAFDLFMRRMDSLYRVTADYCDRLLMNKEQRLMVHLNVQADRARKLSHGLTQQASKFGPIQFTIPTQDEITRDKLRALICQLENNQKELALKTAWEILGVIQP